MCSWDRYEHEHGDLRSYTYRAHVDLEASYLRGIHLSPTLLALKHGWKSVQTKVLLPRPRERSSLPSFPLKTDNHVVAFQEKEQKSHRPRKTQRFRRPKIHHPYHHIRLP